MTRLHDLCPLITEDCDDWLESIGYYKVPASIKYHGNYSGGLYKHSVKVAEELRNLSNKLRLDWERPVGPTLVGLLHDVCKCDDYYYDDFECEWRYNSNKFIDGHGDKSVIMLAGHIQLTEEEIYCIRFHMGAYTDKEQWQYYGKAIEKYPNVLYTHTADMIASKIRGI